MAKSLPPSTVWALTVLVCVAILPPIASQFNNPTSYSQNNFSGGQFRPSQNFNNNNGGGFTGSNQGRPGGNGSGQFRPGQNSQNNQNLRVAFFWKQLDYMYNSDADRQQAISNGDLVLENLLPLGVDAWKDKIFMTVPRWRNGTPATLVWVPKNEDQDSPLLRPYPNWGSHSVQTGQNADCNKIFSVFRINVDSCDRLWVLDSGEEQVGSTRTQTCRPKLLIFNLNTNRLLTVFQFPQNFVRDQGLYASIVVDIRNNQCDRAFAYMTDIWRFGLAVYDLQQNSATLLNHGYFLPDPVFTKYTNAADGFEYRLISGIFSVALGPVDPRRNDRLLYFHGMSSSREFQVPASIVRNQTAFNANPGAVQIVGQSRGPSGHASAAAINKNGVMLFNMVTRNSLACWDTKKPYQRSNLGEVFKDDVTYYFANDLRIENEERERVWVLSNRLPEFLFRQLNFRENNFHVLTGYVDSLIRGTVCDPNVRGVTQKDYDDNECF